MEHVSFHDLGLIDYQKAWDYQTEVHQGLVNLKLENRDKRKLGLPTIKPLHHLLFCEHPRVYTLGKSGSVENLLLSEKELKEHGFSFYKINRGGDITYHGPGQLVAYPIFDLEEFFTDIHKYVRMIEEVVLLTMADYGLQGMRIKEHPGVWMEKTATAPKRKICAVGVHLRRWVTMHGFAFNINPHLADFDNIIPCGIDDKDKGVTSLSKELGTVIPIEEVKSKVKKYFAECFELEYLSIIEDEERYSQFKS